VCNAKSLTVKARTAKKARAGSVSALPFFSPPLVDEEKLLCEKGLFSQSGSNGPYLSEDLLCLILSLGCSPEDPFPKPSYSLDNLGKRLTLIPTSLLG